MFIGKGGHPKTRAPEERNIVRESSLPATFRSSGAEKNPMDLVDYKHFVPPGLKTWIC